eukprot:CAMPEP_0178909016 /NCGR_PEP_ID=MMETSP0786-20121207/8253_1 /TAXON_ID=186022 /ORGANISM="Thalassionema frauenfeldii, Strain CCMP 1798" /LENGTH=274 /DNA_ID=CAMNT_0020581001 /DNA_START=261 /DNA_END=1085 /DNA_ORIENTATION=+
MELAKNQQKSDDDSDNESDEENKNTNVPSVQSKNDQDHKEFRKLLTSTKNALPSEYMFKNDDEAYIAPIKAGQNKVKKKKKQKPLPPTKEELAKRKKEKESKEIAKRIHFESLIDIGTNKQLGNIGAAQLVPWVPPFLNDCLIVFSDPRSNSGDLRQAITYISSAYSTLDEKEKKMITNEVIFITADSAAEIQSWFKRSKLASPPFRIFSDPQLEWMSQYSDLDGNEQGNNPWTISMITFDTDGEVCQRSQNVDTSHAKQLVLDTMKEMATKGN